MLFFFITKAVFPMGKVDPSTELTTRIGNLIEYNMINFMSGAASDEAKMLEAMQRADAFSLEDLKTDFSLTTSAEMKMMFLSMIFAQEFSDSRGIGMPKTIPITVTDYRGY